MLARAGPSCWLLIPLHPANPGSRACGSWNSAEGFSPDISCHPLCVPSFPIWVVSLQTSSFLLPFFHVSWLVLSEQGWVRGEVWQLGLLLVFGGITGRKMQNEERCEQEQRFSGSCSRMWSGPAPISAPRGAVGQAQRTQWMLYQQGALRCLKFLWEAQLGHTHPVGHRQVSFTI